MFRLLMVVCLLFVCSEVSAGMQGVAWGTSRASARATCYSRVPGGRTVVVRGADGMFYGTREFGAFARLKARTVSRSRAVTRTRGHL